MKKRILSCLMALVLCLTLLPTAALAGETEGTAQDTHLGFPAPRAALRRLRSETRLRASSRAHPSPARGMQHP